MMDMIGFAAMLVVPTIGPVLLSYLLTRSWCRRSSAVPAVARGLISGLVAALSPIVYFSAWQSVEVALRDVRGDTSDYMGPMTMLIYGFPIFMLVTLACLIVGGYTSVRAR